MLFTSQSIPSHQLPEEKEADNYGFQQVKNSKLLFANDALDILPEIVPDVCLFYHTTGRWSTHQLTKAVINQVGDADVIITTWAITEKPLRSLLDLKQKGKIKSLTGLFEHKIKSHSSKSFAFAKQFFDEVKLTKIHAKITLISNPEWSITILGSSNWTINRRIEAGVLSTQKEIFEFYKKLIDNA